MGRKVPGHGLARPSIMRGREERGDGKAEYSSLSPRAIVYCKTDSRDARDNLRKHIDNLGLSVTLVQSYGSGKALKLVGHPSYDVGYTVALDVSGEGEALAKFIDSDCVVDWHYAVSCRVGHIAGGSGAEKMRPMAKPLGRVRPDDIHIQGMKAHIDTLARSYDACKRHGYCR